MLIWPVFGLLGFKSGSTASTGMGMMASLFLAAVGLALAVMGSDWLLLACGLLPGATWFGSCAILGTTAQYMAAALRSSESTLETLTRRGILTAESNAE